MTKREIAKWLERKQNETLSDAEKEFNAVISKNEQDLCRSLGFDLVAAEMQEHFEKASKIWDGFKKKCQKVESVSFYNGHANPDSRLCGYRGMK